jgi:hypothetical protein
MIEVTTKARSPPALHANYLTLCNGVTMPPPATLLPDLIAFALFAASLVLLMRTLSHKASHRSQQPRRRLLVTNASLLASYTFLYLALYFALGAPLPLPNALALAVGFSFLTLIGSLVVAKLQALRLRLFFGIAEEPALPRAEAYRRLSPRGRSVVLLAAATVSVLSFALFFITTSSLYTTPFVRLGVSLFAAVGGFYFGYAAILDVLRRGRQ